MFMLYHVETLRSLLLPVSAWSLSPCRVLREDCTLKMFFSKKQLLKKSESKDSLMICFPCQVYV